ncbi:FAD-binding protein [Actinophytocola xanthii]|uniref:23S rRNA methyltransferase n=1 Tax=Actinophytocola xanthii TaxID=1912961 RepID=A0A1Q8CXA8_9PSEU|nr:FAD-binding protein [Actinophytocola xanthii]OLF18988.1 23S rRNA methyltransferase [Actinophytocola xanthii]
MGAPPDWDEQADVVVVGLGAAGACAAVEAARAGADVLVLDRFTGGGATALSGGVVYAGGGTAVQRAAGVTDTVEAMYDYLLQEVGDAVSPATLHRFCASSPEMIDWLAGLGVPFDPSPCPFKTSYPPNAFYLYHSGSENAWPYRSTATPAPRGHRVHAPGTSGHALFQALAKAVADTCRVRQRTSAVRLVVEAGRVAGVECRTLAEAPARVRRRFDRLHRVADKPGLYVPALARRLARQVSAIEARWSRPYRVAARHGVVLATGGFVNNREMMRAHAPAYRGGLPLGTQGDDGSGIRLGVAAGGRAERLGAVSAWRFLTPPSALLGGVLVGQDGRRFVDESSYGAAIGARLVAGGGRAWLLVDERIRTAALGQLPRETLLFQRLQGEYLLRRPRLRGATIEQVARRAGIDPGGLAETVRAYGEDPDAFGKHSDLVTPLTRPPFTAIDVSYGPRLGYPCPVLTLGGLAVDECTGQVLGLDGDPIAGLYAAGRAAVGICSNSYVSGLSLADCVFSGRRAGRAAAVDINENVF